jgi:predicted LPLAT superfamily acyltransferase
VTVVRRFGIAWAYALLVPVGLYFVLFASAALRASHDYRRRLGCGGASRLAGWWNGFRHFYSFGQTLLDRVAIIGGETKGFRFHFDGEEHLRSALERGRGLILVSAHCGNWEVAAHVLGRLTVPVSIVAFEHEVAHIRTYFERVFADRRFSVISMDGSPGMVLEILRTLARGEIVAMHADRVLDPTDQNSIIVPFLGAPARFPTGPFQVAAVSGAPLIHTFAMREQTYHYRLHAYPPEFLSFGKRSERRGQLETWVGRFVAHLEEVLRRHPLQWHNFYPFWAAGGELG